MQMYAMNPCQKCTQCTLKKMQTDTMNPTYTMNPANAHVLVACPESG